MMIDGKEVSTRDLFICRYHPGDAYYAEEAFFVDGEPLTEDQLVRLSDEHGDWLAEIKYERSCT